MVDLRSRYAEELVGVAGPALAGSVATLVLEEISDDDFTTDQKRALVMALCESEFNDSSSWQDYLLRLWAGFAFALTVQVDEEQLEAIAGLEEAAVTAIRLRAATPALEVQFWQGNRENLAADAPAIIRHRFLLHLAEALLSNEELLAAAITANSSAAAAQSGGLPASAEAAAMTVASASAARHRELALASTSGQFDAYAAETWLRDAQTHRAASQARRAAGSALRAIQLFERASSCRGDAFVEAANAFNNLRWVHLATVYQAWAAIEYSSFGDDQGAARELESFERMRRHAESWSGGDPHHLLHVATIDPLSQDAVEKFLRHAAQLSEKLAGLEDATRLARAAKRLAERNGVSPLRERAVQLLSDLNFRQGRLDDALDLVPDHSTVLSLLSPNRDTSGSPQARIFKTREAAYDRYIQCVELGGDVAALLGTIGSNLLLTDSREASGYLVAARAAAADSGHEVLHAILSTNLRVAHESLGDSAAALETAFSGLERFDVVRRRAGTSQTRAQVAEHVHEELDQMLRLALARPTERVARRVARRLEANRQDATAGLLRSGTSHIHDAELGTLLRELGKAEEHLADALTGAGGGRTKDEERSALLARLEAVVGRRFIEMLAPPNELDLPTVPPNAAAVYVHLLRQRSGTQLVTAWSTGENTWHLSEATLAPAVEKLWRRTDRTDVYVPRVLTAPNSPELAALSDALPQELRKRLMCRDAPDLILLSCVGELASVPWAAVPLDSSRRLVDVAAIVHAPAITVYTKGLPEVHAPTRVVAHIARDFEQLAPVVGKGTQTSSVHELRLALDKPCDLLLLAAHGDAAPGLAHAAECNGGPFTAGDLLSARVDGVLVLAACWSTRPSWSRGAEPLGLAAAGLATGARSVVGATWAVPIRAISAIVANLVDGLRDHPAPEALRIAQCQWLADNPNAPASEWATLTAVGC